MILCSTMVVLLAAAVIPAVASATTFYVSPGGHDSASGHSPAHAWRTVYRVNAAKLKPGDEVLFQGGATFSDDALQPGWGQSVSGTARAPVVFGSFGSGRATFPRGIWIKGERYLVFENLSVEHTQGLEGSGSHDTITGCVFHDLEPPAINVIGSFWKIRGNRISRTGDSGMLLRGSHFSVIGNTITDTGLDTSIGYGTHGIYLKASRSNVIGNTINNFHDDGVSVRYPNSRVEGNRIAGGSFGIAWFQYSDTRGVSRWSDNTIAHTRIAAIYVSPSDIGGATDEHFVITDNTFYRPSRNGRAADAGGWLALSLSRNPAGYKVRHNRIL
jgi:hypothetical protein